MDHATSQTSADGSSASTYPLEQLRRPTLQALRTPLKRDFTIADLRAGSNKLAQAAAAQELQVLEQALLTLVSDPTQETAFWWRWELVLPVRGPARAAEDEGISLGRVHGGTYAQVTTHGGFGDLSNLYANLLGEVLPAYRHELTRAEIYHRVISGLEGGSLDGLSLTALIPIQLSIGAPPTLLRRPQHD